MKNLKFVLLVTLPFFLLPVYTAGQKVYDAEDFGAKGDGIFLNTTVLQEAIDSCSRGGGGTVLLKSGTWLSGSVYLKDNVVLHIGAGAVLLGSPLAADYKTIGNFKDGLGHAKNKFFIGASGARNIGITGEGVIDGQGSSPEFKIHKDGRGDVRPSLVKFYNCNGVRVTGITLRNSGAWVSHYFGCTDVLIHNVNIDSWSNGNNDGIDIDCSENVRISNCHISSGDDAIVLKATASRPTRNIVVSGCILHTSTGAFKIGTESVGDIQNVTVSDCAVRGAGGGIKLLCMDGAIVRNVNISDMVMQNVEMPLFVRLGSRLNVFHEGEQKKNTGSMENIRIANIHVDTNSPGRTRGHHLKYQTGIFITGIPGHPVKGLTLDNISIRIHGGGKKEDSYVKVPENPSTYPEFSFFSEWLPAFGAYVRHAEHVQFNNVAIETINPDQRFGIALESVNFFSLKNVQVDFAPGGESFYSLEKVKQGTLSDHFPDNRMKTFVSIQGAGTEGIYLFGNVLENPKETILLLDGAKKSSVTLN